MMNIYGNKKGFTLLELIITLGVFVLVVSFTLAISGNAISDTDLDTKSSELVQALRLARVKAVSGLFDSNWGVYIDSSEDSFTLFQGDSYASRDADFDFVTTLPTSLDFSTIDLTGGGSGVVFLKNIGTVSSYGDVVLVGADGKTETISVNSLGIVSNN